MQKFLIEGGSPLNGNVTPSGNKNEALPVLMACLLTDKPVTIKNIPQIRDVLTLCTVLQKLGVEVEWISETAVRLQARELGSIDPDPTLCAHVRASILLLGPMLARCKEIRLPLPGGDIIGARRIDTHWHGMEALGATLTLSGAVIEARTKSLRGAEIFLDEPSVTATENLLLASVLAEGETTIFNAACEPHVSGLCRLLVAMGASISGIGSNRLEIKGVKTLGGCEHQLSADFMEVGSFICLGAVSGGRIAIKVDRADDYRFIMKTFARLGIVIEMDKDGFVVSGRERPKIQNEVSGRIPTVYSQPWPAFPTDLMSVAIVAATQCVGTTIFFEKMFEGRMFFTDKLMAMGATIILCDPHRVVVNGPCQLVGSNMSSPDVRAGMALLMASLLAKGKSEIDNIVQIERGYYRIEEKLRNLGARIKKIDA